MKHWRKKIIQPKVSKYRLKVGKSAVGFGLFTLETVKRGAKIIEYGGIVLTNDEADKKGGKYLFEMIDGKNTIDGSPRWNLARYANHACKPNCEGVWYGNRIWLCAKRKIQPNEGLTYHYGKDYFQNILGGQKLCRCDACAGNRGR